MSTALPRVVPLTGRHMYKFIRQARDVVPIALLQWQQTLNADYDDESRAWKAFTSSQVTNPCDRDIAFAFIHRVLPSHRLWSFRQSATAFCLSCSIYAAQATLKHIFHSCPLGSCTRVTIRDDCCLQFRAISPLLITHLCLLPRLDAIT